MSARARSRIDARSLSRDDRPPQPVAERRAQEAVRRLDRRRLRDRDGDGHVRREHEVEREVALPRAHVDDEVLGRERAERARASAPCARRGA